jgi:hypothetical protein
MDFNPEVTALINYLLILKFPIDNCHFIVMIDMCFITDGNPHRVYGLG